MGITSSDEYQDVKDEFFIQFYYTEKPLSEIEKSILDDYGERYATFDENDGVWHDVYFALADCEWSCGGLTQSILQKVEEIIKNNRDLAYMESLAASPQDLKEREKALKKFLAKISVRKQKPIARKLKNPYTSPFKTGDVFQYRYKDYYYGGVILQVWDSGAESDIYHKRQTLNFCIAVAEIKSSCALTVEQIENAKVRCVDWQIPYNLPGRGKFEILGSVANKLSKDYRNYFGSFLNYIDDFCGMSYMGIMYIGGFLDIISGEKDYAKHNLMYGVSDKPIKYLYDTNNFLDTKRANEEYRRAK